MKSLFHRSKRPKPQQVKKIILFNGITVKLYELKWTDLEVARNIEAFDQNGNPLWLVEKPTYSLHYWDMQIDEQTGELDADSGSGRHYTINLLNGHIVSSRIVK